MPLGAPRPTFFGVVGVVGRKTKAPRLALRALACAPSGAARVDRSTTGRWSGVSLRLDLFTSPVSPCGVAGDAACRTRHRFPGLEPLAPLHADPVARALGPGAMRNRPRWVQLGWPQFLRLLNHDSVACIPPESDVPPTTRRWQVARHPKAVSVPGRLAAPFVGCGLPRALRTLQQVSVSVATRRSRRPGLTRRPPRSLETFADSS